MNPTELARDKFKALFAVYDARDKHAATQQKLALNKDKKAGTKNVKPQ